MELHVHILDLLSVRLRQRLHLYGREGSGAIGVNPYHQWREIVLGRRMLPCETQLCSAFLQVTEHCFPINGRLEWQG